MLTGSSGIAHQERLTNKIAKADKMAEPDSPMASSILSSRNPFIISSNTEKVDAATRRLIRSHVMQGKQKKKRRPGRGQVPSSCSVRTAGSSRVARVNFDEVLGIYMPSKVPGRVGSDFSLIEFAAEIELSMLLSIVKGMSLQFRNLG